MPEVAEAPLSMGDALKNMPNPPPDDTPKGGALSETPVVDANALKTGTIEEPEIKPLVEDDEDGNDDAPQSMENAMRDAPDVGRKDKDRAAAEQKEKDDAEAEKAKQTDAGSTAAQTSERDADLKHEMAAHTHPKTRKIITDFQSKAKAARDERDAIIAEREALKKERDDLTTKLKSAPLPKEVEDEVKTLRERVRELDISKDPILEQKYDRKITANNTAIIDVLKAQGFGTTKLEKDGKTEYIDNPKAVTELQKSGLTLKNLQPYIKGLEDAGLIDEAEQIRDAVRENVRIARDKSLEIEAWKADHGTRQQVRAQETKQQQDSRQQAFTQQTDLQYRNELAALEKDFAYLKQPPAPLATDTPAVKAAKEAAVKEYAAAAQRIETAVKGLNPEGITPDKQPEVVGRINANAILAIAMKEHVLPALKRDLAQARKERDDAVSELNKIRDAGRISRLHGQAPGGDPNAGQSAPSSLEDAFRNAMPG